LGIKKPPDPVKDWMVCLGAILTDYVFNRVGKKAGSSDFGVINKILKKQYDMPINHLADYKIITTFSFL